MQIKYNSLVTQTLSYFLLLIPFGLLLGPFVPDLMVSLISITFLFLVLMKKDFVYFKNIFFYLFIIFNTLIILISLFSEDPFFSLKSSLVYFRFGIFALAVWFLVEHEKNLLKYFTISLVFSFLIAISFGYYQYFFDENYMINTRLSLMLSENHLLGNYLSRMLPLVIGFLLLFKSDNKLYFYFIGFLFVVTDCIIYISGERTALGLLVMSSIFILVFIKEYKYIRIASVFISLIIIVVITILSPQIKERNIDHTLNQVGMSSSENKIYIFSPQHQSHIMGSIQMFYDKPLFGVGPNLFRKLCNLEKYEIDKNTCSTHPHNIYIQLLAETGIVGLSFLMLVSFYFIIIVFRNLVKLVLQKKDTLDNYTVCLLACFLINLWPFLPTLNFFNNWINVIYYLPVGFYLHYMYSSKLEQKI